MTIGESVEQWMTVGTSQAYAGVLLSYSKELSFRRVKSRRMRDVSAKRFGIRIQQKKRNINAVVFSSMQIRCSHWARALKGEQPDVLTVFFPLPMLSKPSDFLL